jgi:hypothetical protein
MEKLELARFQKNAVGTVALPPKSQVPERTQKSLSAHRSVPRKPALSDAAGRRQGGLATVDGGQARGVSARQVISKSMFEEEIEGNVPSGKHTKNDGKSPCLMGKSIISMAMFNN